MHTIDKTIDITAPLATLHTAITTEAGFRGWWSEGTTYDRESRSFTFRFPQPTQLVAMTFRVERQDDRGIALVCTGEQNNPDWKGTRLEISVAPSGDGTRVHLVHSGYPANNECYAQCQKGWTHFLDSLAQLATTGRGKPSACAA